MNSTDQKMLVRLLKQLEPGFLPYEIFEQVARLAALSIIEFVPLRTGKDGKVEVLLLERAPDDPIWPGMVHSPGTVIRPGDTEGTMYKAFERIVKDELNGTAISNPYYVGSLLHKSRRGTEHAQIYWVEVLGEPRVGTFYPVDELPDNLVESQPKFIKLAAKSYQESENK